MLTATSFALSLLLACVILCDGWFETAPPQNKSIKAVNEYYLLSSFEASWYDALKYCRYYYMELATPETPTQIDRLLSFLMEYEGEPQDHVWYSIGGTNLGHNLADYYWIHTGNWVGNKNFWIPNKPKRQPGCLVFDIAHPQWMFNDAWCDDKRLFICQTEAATGNLH